MHMKGGVGSVPRPSAPLLLTCPHDLHVNENASHYYHAGVWPQCRAERCCSISAMTSSAVLVGCSVTVTSLYMPTDWPSR